jgi:hypothetical protein
VSRRVVLVSDLAHSPLALGGGEKPAPFPVGDSLACSFGGVGDQGRFGLGESDAVDVGAGVVGLGSAGSHGTDNTGHGKSLTTSDFVGHNKSMTTTSKPARNWCSCGRGFYNKAAMLNHGLKCEVEVGRHNAWITAIDEGRNPVSDPAAMIQMPRWTT